MDDALDLAIPLIQTGEGLSLTAYPDPIWRGVPRSPAIPTWGTPWTIGYGETLGVREGDVWTREQAVERLRARVATFLLRALKSCPQLHLEPPARIAACISLAYNIGSPAFAASTVRLRTARSEYSGAADAFLWWNKAGGRVMRGLTNRRKHEREIYLG